MGFNLFGSSKGSDNNSQDNRQDNSKNVHEGGMLIEGDYTVTDGGAFELAGQAIGAVENVSESAFGHVTKTTDSAFDFASSVLGDLAESNDNAIEKLENGYASSLGAVERLAASENSTTSKSIEKIGMMLVGGLVLTFGFMAWSKK